MRGPRPFLAVLVVVLCVAAVTAIVALITDDEEQAARVAATTIAVFAYGCAALAGLSVAGKPAGRLLAAATVIAAAVAFALLMPVAWSDDVGEGQGNAAWVSFFCALALGYAALLISRARPWEGRAVRVIRAASLVADVVLAAMLVIAVLAQIDDITYYRWTAALAVLWTLGTMLVPTVRAMLHADEKRAQS